MGTENHSVVIAISGASGVGKTSLVHHVVQALDDAVPLFFDQYTSTHERPEDLAAWAARGFDPREWKNPRLAEDLRLLRNGTPVTPPGDPGHPVNPAAIIVLEEPFGRTREGMADLVDFVAHIELPLELALARKVKRTLDFADQKEGLLGSLLPWMDMAKAAEGLRRYLDWYVDGYGREMYLSLEARLKEDCDLLLDGRAPLSEMAEEVVHHLSGLTV